MEKQPQNKDYKLCSEVIDMLLNILYTDRYLRGSAVKGTIKDLTLLN